MYTKVITFQTLWCYAQIKNSHGPIFYLRMSKILGNKRDVTYVISSRIGQDFAQPYIECRPNRMAWQWAETLVEIRGTLADIRGTTK